MILGLLVKMNILNMQLVYQLTQNTTLYFQMNLLKQQFHKFNYHHKLKLFIGDLMVHQLLNQRMLYLIYYNNNFRNAIGNIFLKVFPASKYKHIWIVDPASHGKGIYFRLSVFFNKLGICDAFGSVVKRAISSHLRTRATFRTLVDLFDFLNTLSKCIPIVLPHLNEIYCLYV